jgi:hypothetical protein
LESMYLIFILQQRNIDEPVVVAKKPIGRPRKRKYVCCVYYFS